MKNLLVVLLSLLCSLALASPLPAASPQSATRPVGSTGKGFYVSGARLYDPAGIEFRPRGVNHNHWDNGSPGIARSGANAVRYVLDFSLPVGYNWGIVRQGLAAHQVPIPGNWDGTCNSDPAVLARIVDTWVAQASTWTQLNTTGLVNIANEWGPPDNPAWRDSYIAAIKRMRAAGYTGTLVVDSGGCGQDPNDVVKYGAAVLAGDPQHNILFDVHVYGNFVVDATKAWQTDYAKSMAALKASGLPIILGEFGPGRNIGPSPTMLSPVDVILTAEDAGWGWLAWAWDDNNLDGCRADDRWFAMSNRCGAFDSDDDLTTFGRILVPLMRVLAKPAHGI